ncbi:MAG TPA: anti sigma factor C-terminal domain-containing protein [Pseudobacteroides sp.]|uniref:anti sigma factor C-terminal domain-containing protein n=1 Tax=Pseudobacteroides sp. TaxID=1968840 RepID=UPI002F955C61
MKCKEVQEKIPEYLAGILDKSSKTQMQEHLENCVECSSEIKLINDGFNFGFVQEDIINQNKIIKKTRAKFNMEILRSVSIIIAVFILILGASATILKMRSAVGQEKASRALMDVVQFSQPNMVNMWGNSTGSVFSVSLKIGARSVVGKKYGEQFEYIGNMSAITGKVSVPVIIGANFVHPGLYKGQDFDRDRNVKAQTDLLKRNIDTTVATVDYSLKNTISLEYVEKLIGRFDVEICWMAVEAGIEDVKPQNMTLEKQQVLQWGIPGKLSRPGHFQYSQLKEGKIKEYEKSVLEEIKWLDDNKDLLIADKSLLSSNGIDNSVKEKAAYILKNGIKIYGLRITGPSSELVKLTGELDARTMSVIDMSFWNW